jgi:alkaline phosphatase D
MRSLSISMAMLLVLVALATGQNIERIAIIGGHRQNRPAPALAGYTELKADLNLWIGDNVYADTENDPDFIRACYAKLAARPAFPLLRENALNMATWDDHDLGRNDGGGDYPLKAESREIFRSFWGLEKEIPQAREGVYYAKNFDHGGRRLQVIMLDVRYNRDLPGKNGDVLGEEQWQWLGEKLREKVDLRLVVSGFQYFLSPETGSETWSSFPLAQARFVALLRQSAAERTIFIAGDQHYGEVSRLPNIIDHDFIELQFCGVNQIEKPEANPWRVTPVIASLNSVAWVDIQWEQDEYNEPHLVYTIINSDKNAIELRYRVNFSELTFADPLPAETLFSRRMQLSFVNPYPYLDLRVARFGEELNPNTAAIAEPISLSDTEQIRAAYFTRDGHRRSRIYRQNYVKAIPRPAVDASPVSKGLRYDYYEGEFTVLPDFASLSNKQSGVSSDFDVTAIARRDDHYAIRFRGFIEVAQTGLYEFYTYSDDGSRLFIGETLVVDNDGSHSRRLRMGKIALQAGLHPLQVDYFEDYSGQVLEVGYGFVVEGQVSKVDERQLIDPDQLFHEE